MRYRGFISYSRKDRRIAKRLHYALEQFRVPNDIAVKVEQRKLGRFFLDDDELRASEHLGSALNGAVDDSENLIVVASPDAAQSVWVNKEICHFKRRGGARVFAVIARGYPNSNDQDSECFPLALKYQVDANGTVTGELADPPLAADLTHERFSRAFIRLVAALLNVEFDALWQRARRRTRYRRTIVGASITTGLCASVLVVANAVTTNDMAALRDRSIEISTEQWRYFDDPNAFDSSFRAALAAARLARPDPREPWNVNGYSDATSRALALSGRALPVRRVFGKYPDSSMRDNYRDDILDVNPLQRVAIYAESNAQALSFSRDSKRLGVIVSNGHVLIYDVLTGNKIHSESFSDVDVASRIALDESGQQALVGTRKNLHLINTDSGVIETCPMHKLGGFHELSWLANRWVFTASSAGHAVVGIFEPKSCQITESAEIPGFTPYNSHAFSTGDTMFVGVDGFESPSLIPVLTDFSKGTSITFDGIGDGVGQVKVIAVEPTQNLVALGGNGSGGGVRAGVQLVSLKEHAEVARLIGHTGEVYAIDFMPGTDLIVTGGSDFSIRLWEVASGNEVMRLGKHLGDIHDARFSANGAWLATSSSDGMVLLWDVSSLKARGRYPLWKLISEQEHGEWPSSTVVTLEDRQEIEAFQGRPWDVLDWHDPATVHGAIQSIRAMLVRWFGWSIFDYASPSSI